MNCEDLKSSMLRWFGEELECHSNGRDSLTATLPILKPNGDPIEIGIESAGAQQWRLSDLGETYSTLYLAGVDLFEEYVRAEEFRQIVAAHRIKDSEKELSVEASSGDLVGSVFDFVHAIQSMLALQLTVKPKLEGRDFPSMVAKFLAEHGASFEIPSEHVDGKTGRWKFNFIFNHVLPPTLVKALSVTSKNQALKFAEQSVFEIRDVQEVKSTEAVVIADDEGSRAAFWQPQVLRIFDGYEIPVYPFTAKREELARLARRYSH